MNLESTRILADARTLTVATIHDRQLATDLFDAIRSFRKQCEEQKELTVRPLKAAYDSAKIPFDGFIKECQTHEKALTDKMFAYDLEVDRLARIEQARLQALTDKANAKIEARAEAKGIAPVFKAAPVVPTPPKTVVTQAGTTQTRRVHVVYTVRGVEGEVRADNPLVAALLRDYPALFVLDPVRFQALAKTGMLDIHPSVTKTEQYIYTQRQGG
jgi:hypothetical protein